MGFVMDRLIYTAFQSINNALDNKAIRSQNLPVPTPISKQI